MSCYRSATQIFSLIFFLQLSAVDANRIVTDIMSLSQASDREYFDRWELIHQSLLEGSFGDQDRDRITRALYTEIGIREQYLRGNDSIYVFVSAMGNGALSFTGYLLFNGYFEYTAPALALAGSSYGLAALSLNSYLGYKAARYLRVRSSIREAVNQMREYYRSFSQGH